MKTYCIEMSDGRRWDRIAHSAADAIQRALEANTGHKVLKCWIGDEEPSKGLWGRTVYEVPNHEAIQPAAKLARAKDATTLLFDEGESIRLGVIKAGRD